MLKSSFFDYSDSYILVKGTISVVGQGADAAVAVSANRNYKEMIFKSCAPFNYCMSEINNSQLDNAKNLDVVMPI